MCKMPRTSVYVTKSKSEFQFFKAKTWIVMALEIKKFVVVNKFPFSGPNSCRLLERRSLSCSCSIILYWAGVLTSEVLFPGRCLSSSLLVGCSGLWMVLPALGPGKGGCCGIPEFQPCVVVVRP